MPSKIDSFEQEFEIAAQHLAALRQQLEQLPDRRNAPSPALEGLAQAMLALRQAHDDLSRQKEAGAAHCQDLEQQLGYYRDLFEHALHPRLLTDLSGVIREANAPASILLQTPQDELSGQQLAAFLPEQERETLSEQLAQLQAGGAVHGWEVTLQPFSGEAVAVCLDAVPVHGPRQQIVGLQWLLRDISRQAKAEEALRRNEDLLRSFVEQSFDGIALTDEQGQVIEWNRAMEQITGLSTAEAIGRPIWDVQLQLDGGADLAPGVGEQLKDRFLDLLRSGQAPWLGRLLERSYTHPDGTRRVVQGAVFPFKTQAGFMLGSVSRDVTQLKQTEEALREREKSLRQAVEVLEAVTSGAEVVVAAQDTSLHYIFFNEAYRQEIQRLTGKDIHLGSSMVETFAHMPELQRSAVEQWSRALQGESANYRIEFGDPAGYRRIYSVRHTPIRDLQGNVVGAGEVAFDVTEQARTEEALRQSENKYRFLVDSLHEGIWLIDKDAVTTFVNPRMADMLGYTVDEMVGAHLFSFVDDKNLDFVQGQIERRRQGIKENVDVELRRKDGTPVFANLEVTPLFDAEGQYTGALAGIADITARRRAEQERERLLAQALDAHQRIEAISAQAQRQADELGAILNAIPDPVAVWDAHGNVLRANAAAAALGIVSDEKGMVGVAERLSVRHPGGRPVLPEELPVARALNGEVIRNETEILVNLAGEELEILVSVAPVVSGGEITACVVVSHDITELKRAEAAMRESEGKLSALFELMPVGISVLDGERRMTQTNAALTRLLGLSREALLQGNLPARTYLRSDGTAMPPDEFPSARAWQEQKLVHDQVGIVKEDGAVIWTEVNAAPVPFADWKLVVATVDVTERKRIEQALRQARDELERRVLKRTAELESANQRLLAEIRQRMRTEGELRLSEQRLEQRVEERTRVLTSLLDISNTVALSIDLEALLALILERLKDVIDYDGGAAFRLEGKTLNPVFHRGAITADELLQIGSHLEAAVLGETAVPGVERVILADVQGEPALQEAFRQATGTKLGEMANTVRAWMTIPVTIKQQVYGVLYMYHSHPGRYTEEEAKLALPFGNQAALAIENVRIYEQAAELAALEERQRLARELHDAVTQTLFSASLAAEVLPRLWERDREAGLDCLSEVHQLTRGALAEMRTLLLELRPAALVETELKALLSQLAEAATSRARIPVTVQGVPHCSLPPEVQVALYRIAQEALNNVVKHAEAKHAEVNLQSAACSSEEGPSQTTMVELSVTDDGHGFDPQNLPGGSRGLGLSIMRERAEAVGAAVQIESQPGQGTCIKVIWSAED